MMSDEDVQRLTIDMRKQYAMVQLILNKYWLLFNFSMFTFFITGAVFGYMFGRIYFK